MLSPSCGRGLIFPNHDYDKPATALDTFCRNATVKGILRRKAGIWDATIATVLQAGVGPEHELPCDEYISRCVLPRGLQAFWLLDVSP